LAVEKQLKAYRHTEFWQPMDTLSEKQILESLWATGEAPWKIW
jgi:glucose-1-phosphate cytidylyltransferase